MRDKTMTVQERYRQMALDYPVFSVYARWDRKGESGNATEVFKCATRDAAEALIDLLTITPARISSYSNDPDERAGAPFTRDAFFIRENS